MYVHNFNPVLVNIGFLEIKWYSLAYILGIVIGWIYAIKIISITRTNNYHFEQIKKNHFDDLIIYLVLGMVLGGRLGYVFFYNFSYYSQNYLEIFKIWQGGMSFHGGLLGVIVAIIIFSYNTNTNFFKYADIVSCVAPIGIFFGRIANFINGELYGKISSYPWSIVFPNVDNESRHPSQIYEALLEGIILFTIINIIAIKKKKIFKTGYVSCFFLVIYSILRIISENFREPDEHLGYFLNYFSLGTLLSVATLISGFLIYFFVKKNE